MYNKFDKAMNGVQSVSDNQYAPSTGESLASFLASGKGKYRIPFYGNRWEESTKDFTGVPKGSGWKGEIPAADGKKITEYTIGMRDGSGKIIEIPTVVPTLTDDELAGLASNYTLNDSIVSKAREFAKYRMSQGQSPFYNNGPKQ